MTSGLAHVSLKKVRKNDLLSILLLNKGCAKNKSCSDIRECGSLGLLGDNSFCKVIPVQRSYTTAAHCWELKSRPPPLIGLSVRTPSLTTPIHWALPRTMQQLKEFGHQSGSRHCTVHTSQVVVMKAVNMSQEVLAWSSILWIL